MIKINQNLFRFRWYKDSAQKANEFGQTSFGYVRLLLKSHIATDTQRGKYFSPEFSVIHFFMLRKNGVVGELPQQLFFRPMLPFCLYDLKLMTVFIVGRTSLIYPNAATDPPLVSCAKMQFLLR